jgi:HEAT repeat protein
VLAVALACSALYALLAEASGFEWPGAAAIDAQDLSSLDQVQRQRAAERLALRGGPGLRPGLATLLDDSAPSVRLIAARILARDGAPEAIESATRWTISATPANRRLGLDVLRDAPPPLPAPALRAVERSLSDADVTVRLLAIDTLSRQRDIAPSLLPIAAATEDDNREVRLRAVRALALSHDRRAVVPLLPRLGDVDRQIRVEAIHALAELGDPRAAPALKRLLDDVADDVRIAAALALGHLKIADAAPTIAALMRRRPFEEFARQAALALGELATPDAIAFLIDRLREPPLSDELLAGLLHAGAAAMPALVTEAQHGTPSSSAAAVTLLGRLRAGSRGADPALTRVLVQVIQGHTSTAATAAALDALAAIRDPESLPVLFEVANDPTAETRRACFRALIAIGDERALPLLERGLSDHDAEVRALALRLGAGLGMSTPGALGALVARLGDPNRAVSQQAVATLVQMGRRVPGTLEPLLALLARAPADRAVADALEIAATPPDDGALLAAARRSSGVGRRAIARALVAAHAAQPIESDGLAELLLDMAAAGGAEAEVAADALTRVRPTRGVAEGVARAFDAAEPQVRPRLCAALATVGGDLGRERLVALVAAADTAAPVRAAGAWALALAPDLSHEGLAGMAALRLALTRAGTSHFPAVAANASAALATIGRRAGGKSGSASLRLLAPDGAPIVHELLSLTAADGTVVWTMSGLDGSVHLSGLAPGPYQVRLNRPEQRIRIAERTSVPPP